MSKATVLIADDHTLFAEGLRRLVETEFECVGLATRGREALKLARQLSPSIILLDIVLPDINGVEVARRISRISAQIKILVVSMMSSYAHVRQALAAGASGYISKECAASDLLLAIREVLEGRTFVNAESFWENPGSSPQSEKNLLPLITDRQREVLKLVAQGLPAKTIAHELSISPKTVEFHKTAMIRTLSLRNTAELIRFAIENGLLAPTRVEKTIIPFPNSPGAGARDELLNGIPEGEQYADQAG